MSTGRLPRFEEYRWVGTRDTMVAYDCDDPDQLAELKRKVERDDLYEFNQLQTFAPDQWPEVRNRGFTARRRT
jgi:hypothetical protein